MPTLTEHIDHVIQIGKMAVSREEEIAAIMLDIETKIRVLNRAVGGDKTKKFLKNRIEILPF